MNKEEIQEYLKMVDELELKLTDEDKDTYHWLLFGYNECARLLNEKEQENQQLKEQVQDLKADYGTIAQIERDLYKEVIEEVREYAKSHFKTMAADEEAQGLLQILDKAKENKQYS